MPAAIRTFRLSDYAGVLALWQASEGVGLSGADSREGIRDFLQRNRGLSFVAKAGGQVVGAVLAGHDGRRGFLYHLAVASEWRRRGVGRKLVAASLARLRAAGIQKCHIVVFARNKAAQKFWRRIGWLDRTDLKIMSQNLAP
jgi:putative acetyltransferase